MKHQLLSAENIGADLIELMAPYCERGPVFAGSVRRRVPLVGDLELVAIPQWEEVTTIVPQLALFPLAPPPVRANRLHQLLGQKLRDFYPVAPRTDWESLVDPAFDPLWTKKSGGAFWKLFSPEHQIKVDVWLCTPETWGVTLMIRTGSGVDGEGREMNGFGPGMLARWKFVAGGKCSACSHAWTRQRVGGKCPACGSRHINLASCKGSRLTYANGTQAATPEEEDVFRACDVPWIDPSKRKTSQAIREALAAREYQAAELDGKGWAAERGGVPGDRHDYVLG